MAPVANREALVLSSNCLYGFGGMRTGSLVTTSFSALTASSASGVHWNTWFFFVRSVRGFAFFVKFLMNGHWYPMVPKNFQTSDMLDNFLLYSLIPAILLGSIEVSPFLTWILRKSILGCSNTHFSGHRYRSFSSNILKKAWLISQ